MAGYRGLMFFLLYIAVFFWIVGAQRRVCRPALGRYTDIPVGHVRHTYAGFVGALGRYTDIPMGHVRHTYAGMSVLSGMSVHPTCRQMSVCPGYVGALELYETPESSSRMYGFRIE